MLGDAPGRACPMPADGYGLRAERSGGWILCLPARCTVLVLATGCNSLISIVKSPPPGNYIGAMAGKLFIRTFGCQMNEYDSQKMQDLLRESHGLELTDDPERADVLLLNTCSIREKAQEKVFSQLGVWKDWKRDRPGLVIGVGGCVTSQEGETIRERAPYVDLVFGPQTLHRLPQMLSRAQEGHEPTVDISFPEIEKFDRLPEPRAEGPSAFVSIMEGCSKYLSLIHISEPTRH